MRRRRRRDPFKIGLLIIAALAVITYFSFSKRVPFVHGYRLDAVFQSANQLRPGNQVRIAGVSVGKVRSVSIGPGDTAVVHMELQKSAEPIHADATARIHSRLFLEGGYVVDINPGSPSAPDIPDQGTIPLPQTRVPVQFFQVLNTFNHPVRDDLRTMVATLAGGLRGGGAEGLHALARPAAPLLRDLAWLAQGAQGTAPHDVSNFIGSAARLGDTFSSRRTQLAELVTALARTSRALASEDTNLSATIREADLLLRETPSRLVSINRAVPSLLRLSRELRPSLEIAPPVLTSANATLVQLDALTRPGELPLLLTRLRPALAALPPVTIKLTRVLPKLKPVVDCLRFKAIPVLKMKVPDGALSTGRPVWQDLAHSFGGLASAAQSFDGNGNWTRYLAGGSQNTISTGNLPGLGSLVGQPAQPIAGARPRWFGTATSAFFRPDVPCRTQKLPDLSARAG